MKNAMVSELKARLSSYLAEIRAGQTVVVYDRKTPVARLVPYREDRDDFAVIEAVAPPESLMKIGGVRPGRRVDVDKLLRETRGDR
jgi:prevent-host-death family protein